MSKARKNNSREQARRADKRPSSTKIAYSSVKDGISRVDRHPNVIPTKPLRRK